MKEHKAPFPITVQVIEGKIDFGVEGANFELVTGDLIGLEANIPHDLKAIEESIVRLSLSKLDSVQRVQKV
jgi:quercetin dioxygenase-like cupin family protein